MRKTIALNNNWRFTRTDAGLITSLPTTWQEVCLPHTWNAIDGQDGRGEYYRGACWYAKAFATPTMKAEDKIYIDVLAAGQTGRVFVNGKEAIYHEGGYSSFCVDITDLLNTQDDNLLAICVDNTDHTNIYPQMADFTFYGGLYRGVNLIVVSQAHFTPDYWGAEGLAVTATPKDGSAVLTLRSWVKNADENHTVRYEIFDAEQKLVGEMWRPAQDPNGELILASAHLWQGVDDPYLYTCKASLVRRNEVMDEVSCRFGVREFSVDPEKGFFLNGKAMMLRGVSRHQDRLYKGNALTRAEHFEDAAIMHELGVNTVRLAHYQHSRDFYEACDEYGFVVWAEIPYISSQSDDIAAHENCRTQMKELVYQNINHASICFWGLSNEITIAGEKEGLVDNHKDLQKLVKSIDPTRLTTIAHVSMLAKDSALHGISDVESYNHYFGWYGGNYNMNEEWFDSFHAQYPHISIGLSEYGAEGIVTYQPDEAKCRDYSESYQAEYHEHMAKILMERPFLWSTHVWNMFDFGCAARNEGGVAGRNNKGLVTLDRAIRKEAFYVYKAYWSRDPFVYVCGRRYSQRAQDTTTVKVYSNLSEVTLLVNGEPFTTLKGDKIFVFNNIPLAEGFTQITAMGNACTDSIALQKVAAKPEIYTLPPDEDDTDGVENWFEQTEAADPALEMQFPDGYFSVRDKIKDIITNDEAYAVLSGSLYAMTGMKLKKAMLAMIGMKTLEGMSEMMKGMGGATGESKVPADALLRINIALNKIKK